jgi:integrase
VKKKNRGMGFCYQPSYVENGIKKTAATWWIQYSVHGRRIRENAHTTKETDAVKLLKQKIGEAGIGKAVGPQVDKTTVGDLFKMLENDYASNSRRSAGRMLIACAHLSAYFDDTSKARDISVDRITAFQAHRLAEKAKPSTVNYECAMLRRAFRLAVRAGRVAVRPEFDMLHVSNTRKGFFEPDQFRAVLKHLPEHLRPVAMVAYATGWRTKSELLTRQWRHVDFTNSWLRLDPNESKSGEPRMFPLTPELRAILEDQRDYVSNIERSTGSIIPWVFVNPLGQGRAVAGARVRDFRAAWANACRDAGVPGMLVHDLRRTAVRNLERATVSRSAAMQMTGHRTEAVFRRYAITDSGVLKEAAGKLAALHTAQGIKRASA